MPGHILSDVLLPERQEMIKREHNTFKEYVTTKYCNLDLIGNACVKEDLNLVKYLTKQRRIQNPVKHQRWDNLQNN